MAEDLEGGLPTAGDGSGPPPDERAILYQIIRTVSSSVDLDEVLRGVVRLIVEGAQAQSCFVWLVEGGGRLVLRAASDRYAQAVGRAVLGPGEGLAGWAAEHRRPVFLPDAALADPRARYFPEFEEERYQSMVSVPLVGKDEAVFGVIGIHSLAPRTLTEDDARFVIHAASLVAGAVENARLYAAARRRVEALERLADLSVRTAGASRVEELLPAVEEVAQVLLRADEARVEVGEARGRTAPPALSVTLAADGDVLGRLVVSRHDGEPFDDADRDLAGGIAAQAAIGLKKLDLIERLTDRTLIRDLLADLAAGRLDGVRERARRLGWDQGAELVAVAALPWRGDDRDDAARLDAIERFEEAITAALPGVMFDRRGDTGRGLVPVRGDADRTADELRAALGPASEPLPLVVGVSSSFVGPTAAAVALRSAAEAARAAPALRDGPGVVVWDDLGPYKYLLGATADPAAPDRHRAALRRLRDYDRARRTELTRTLEELLARRGHVGATAEALYVHPNTLRQRLTRISAVSGLDVRSEDWLTLEIALRLLRLEDAIGQPASPGRTRPLS